MDIRTFAARLTPRQERNIVVTNPTGYGRPPTREDVSEFIAEIARDVALLMSEDNEDHIPVMLMQLFELWHNRQSALVPVSLN